MNQGGSSVIIWIVVSSFTFTLAEVMQQHTFWLQ